MNYILFYLGRVPNHVEYTLNSILSSDQNAQIYFCTDKKYERKNIINIDFNNFQDLNDKNNEIKSLLKNTPLQENPLWSSSLMRIYVLKKLAENLNLNEFVHFDTDIIVYNSFENIQKSYKFNYSKLNITLLDNSHLVFGYSYFPKKVILDQIYQCFENIFNDYSFFKNKYGNGGTFNEMKMMNVSRIMKPELFSLLPSIPYFESQILFDPAGYGQFLDGSHTKNGNYYFKRRYISTTSEVGKELKSKRIKFIFKNNLPTVIYKKSNFQLCNLHVHSKRLHKFLPSNYKSHI